MQWIYLSPHFDDAALSCGGLIWEQARAGLPVSIWTICAGEPLENWRSPFKVRTPFITAIHARWGVDVGAVAHRREEDLNSCRILGASYRHFPILDCIYRGSDEPIYASEEALFGGLHPSEKSLIDRLSGAFAEALADSAVVRSPPALDQSAEHSGRAALPGVVFVCPLTLGRHVDHQLTRAAAERLARPLLYYADYPYVLKEAGELDRLRQSGWVSVHFPISDEGLSAWEAAVAAHASQISTFWAGMDEMREGLCAYSQDQAGLRLWKGLVKDCTTMIVFSRTCVLILHFNITCATIMARRGGKLCFHDAAYLLQSHSFPATSKVE
jgi:LmbE family N-acetylglucosaminyl deacetylase